MPSSPRPSRPSRPPESPARRALRVMLTAVFGLHVAAIAVHQLAGIGRRSGTVRGAFLAGWMAATVAIVAAGLYRMRAARDAARRARGGATPPPPPPPP